MMRQYDLRLHEASDAWIVAYGKEPEQEAPALSLLDQPFARLTFLMQLKNPDFLRFTSLPAAIGQKRLYFSTHSLAGDAGAGDFSHVRQVYLAGGKAFTDANEAPPVFVGEADLLPVAERPAFFYYPDHYPEAFPIPASEAETTMAVELTEAVSGRSAFSDLPEEAASEKQINWRGAIEQGSGEWERYEVDLRDFPVGEYQITIGEALDDRFFRRPEEAGLTTIGYLSVLMGGQQEKGSPFLRECPENAPGQSVLTPLGDGRCCLPHQFNVRFANRQVCLRYIFIVLKQQVGFTSAEELEAGVNFQIRKPATPSISFSTFRLTDAGTHWRLAIHSEQPVALQQTTDTSPIYELEITGLTEKKTTVRLPFPDPALVKPQWERPPGWPPDAPAPYYYFDSFIYL